MAETRWLNQDEHHTWRSYLAATRLLNAQLDRELQQDSGIPHTYYEILVRLSESPDRRLRMSDLADASESSRSRLSHAVARLVANGWVEREICATDRRGAFAVLTDAGLEALSGAAPAHVESVRSHLFDHLSPEQVIALGQITDRILEGLRESCEEVEKECSASRQAAGPISGRLTA